MKLSNKILLGILVIAVMFQLVASIYARSIIKKAMYESNDISQSLWHDLMDSEIQEKEFNFDDFSEIKLRMEGKVFIKKSDKYKITVKAPIDFLESKYFDVSKNGNTLTIDYPKIRNNNYDFYTVIELPELRKLKVEERIDVILEGFDENNTKIQLTGDCTLKGNNNKFDDLILDAFGEIDIDMSNSTIIDAKIRSLGEIDIQMETKNVNITAVGESDFIFHMTGGKISGSIIGDGNVSYSGDISKNNLSFLGPGKVRKR